MKTINLNNLLRAIHNAVIDAQKITEQQHIRQLRNYFDWPEGKEDKNGIKSFTGGRARTWSIEVPNMHPDAGKVVENEKGEWITPIPATNKVNVPILSLVPMSAIKIDNMTMEFQVGIRGFIDENRKSKASRFTPSDPSEHNGPLTIELGGTGGFFRKSEPVAKVKIEFKSTEPSEAIMRINDYLIKSIL
jgi:hypothetical protein